VDSKTCVTGRYSANMLLSRLLTVTALAHISSAHVYLYALWINGKDMGRGDGKPGEKGSPQVASYIRATQSNNPIKNVMSKDLTCNTPGTPAVRYLDVKSGDKVKLYISKKEAFSFRKMWLLMRL
jgi:hypothetical protein